ncbi:hypothetical protein V7O62_05620 [Methanolobus sp. ZRKC2]|uniref:hypothetical protein n=1 Tax=Methanolobus sp. ZRKC2 TaxID=3125783 RepID=UPI00324EE916
MVTGTNPNTNESKKTDSGGLMSYGGSNNEYEKEGFYSACGQAFIRVSPIKKN